MRPKLLMLASLLACGAPEIAADAPETAVAASPRGPELRAGELHLYALAWQARAGDGEAGPVGGGLSLRGQLALQAIEARAGGTLVALWFPELPERELTALGEAIEVAPELLVGPRAYAVVEADGELRRTWFEPTAPPLFRQVMGGALARIDLRGAAAGPEPRVVPGLHGLAEVRYRRDDDGTVRRDLQRVVRFDALPGAPADAPAISGAAALAVDERGGLVSLAVEERAVVGGDAPVFASEERFALTRVDRRAGEAIEAPDLSTMIERDAAAPPDMEEASRALSRRFAEGLTLADVAFAVGNIDNGLLPREGFVIRATGLLRGWPELADEMPALLRAAETGRGRRLVFDLLSSAGTPAAQRVLRDALAGPEAAGWPELPSLVQRLALVQRPTRETGWFAVDYYDAARASGRDELRRATLYPLGSLAGRLLAGDSPWAAVVLHARLLDALAAADDVPDRVAALAGLGNAGFAVDRERVLAYLHDEDAQVRAAAASALRRMVAPETTAALLAALRDPDDLVAAQALMAVREHLPGPAAATRLAEVVAGDAYHAALAVGLADVLAELPDDPAVRRALEHLAASEDPQARARARLRLAERPGA